MSRGIPAATLSTLFAISAGDPMFALVTISHPKITTRRHVRNTQDVVSRLETFTAASFDVRLPEQREDAPPTASLLIDAVDQSVIADILAVDSPATVLIEIVMQSDPDAVLAAWSMQTRAARWTVTVADIELGADPVLDEHYPGPTYSPGRYPALFGL